MKTYLDPQPWAVKRLNNLQNQPGESDYILPSQQTLPEDLDQVSDKEIFLRESEEQAWKDSLAKYGLK